MDTEDWSEELKELTRNYYVENNEGFVKSKEGLYGILLQDPDSLSCSIKDLETNETKSFVTLEGAIYAGWVVD